MKKIFLYISIIICSIIIITNNVNSYSQTIWTKSLSTSVEKRLDSFITSLENKRNSLTESEWETLVNNFEKKLNRLERKYKNNENVLPIILYLKNRINKSRSDSEIDIFFRELWPINYCKAWNYNGYIVKGLKNNNEIEVKKSIEWGSSFAVAECRNFKVDIKYTHIICNSWYKFNSSNKSCEKISSSTNYCKAWNYNGYYIQGLKNNEQRNIEKNIRWGISEAIAYCKNWKIEIKQGYINCSSGYKFNSSNKSCKKVSSSTNYCKAWRYNGYYVPKLKNDEQKNVRKNIEWGISNAIVLCYNWRVGVDPISVTCNRWYKKGPNNRSCIKDSSNNMSLYIWTSLNTLTGAIEVETWEFFVLKWLNMERNNMQICINGNCANIKKWNEDNFWFWSYWENSWLFYNKWLTSNPQVNKLWILKIKMRNKVTRKESNNVYLNFKNTLTK